MQKYAKTTHHLCINDASASIYMLEFKNTNSCTLDVLRLLLLLMMICSTLSICPKCFSDPAARQLTSSLIVSLLPGVLCLWATVFWSPRATTTVFVPIT